MKTKLFSTYDSKAQVYGKIFQARSEAECIRSLKQVANDPKHEIGMYAEDYALFYLGEYDDISGKIELPNTPKSICSAHSLVDETIKMVVDEFPTKDIRHENNVE